MSLFQHSVLNKYLKEANQDEMKLAYQKLVTYFHNPTIQQNIRESKEEQFQEGFLRELFVNVLGYTINPTHDYNLTTEFKNERGAKKADGAILVEGAAIGVIELKSTKTKDLEAIRLQAFDYKANQQKCVYVITSNFEKIRFYINNAVEYEEFDLFRLEYEHFQILWLCLAKENLLKGIPLAIKEASILKEENITKKIYVDYSLFKHELYNDLIKNNLNLEILRGKDEKEIKLTLFQKSQKLLDRFLFIFFGEDRGLLPPNSISEIIKQWEQLRELDEYKPLYARFKKYFNHLNKGWKGQKYEIFAYNGGLFAPDEILDTISISDEILKKYTEILTGYDFESEVDVNILGHIFENSLNEIEEITAQIEGIGVDLKKSKRKKDGVFYTPKYITKYIVENTVGKLCDEKKTELEIDESEYLKSRKGRTIRKLKELDTKLDIYRNWLLTLTICDPACGSGAFLNQALDFLIREHCYIDELKAKLLDVPMIFTEVENSILEKNIFGVDINEESVEIAKLSLWLRTAQKGRKLTTLSNNIKCGNSLIDDPDIAGKKAFNWRSEFPEVFKNGGFDVVIGNPPYGAELHEEEIKYIEKNFKSFEYQVNSYVVFYEKGLNITCQDGVLGYITPATFTYQHYFRKIRNMFNQLTILSISKYFYEVFDDADIGDSVSWIVQNKANNYKSIRINKCKNKADAINLVSELCNHDEIVNQDGTYDLNETEIDIKSLLLKGRPLGELCQIIVGIKPYQTNKGRPKQTKEIVEAKVFTSTKQEDNSYINCIIGKDFHRYRYLNKPQMYLSYGEWLAEPRAVAPFFENEKIIIRQTSDSLIGTIDTERRINLNNVYNVGRPSKEVSIRYLLGLINSKLLNLIYQNIAQEKGRLFAEVKKINLEKLPIVISTESKFKIEENVEIIIQLNNSLANVNNKLIHYIQSKFALDAICNKLLNWHDLEFIGFINELNKAITKEGRGRLSKIQEMEWIEVFESKKAEAQTLKSEIDKTDNIIDQMVYELYGLTEEEIKIVEGNL